MAAERAAKLSSVDIMSLKGLPVFEGSIAKYLLSDQFAKLENLVLAGKHSKPEIFLENLRRYHAFYNCVIPAFNLQANSPNPELAKQYDTEVNDLVVMMRTFYETAANDNNVDITTEEQARILRNKLREVIDALRGIIRNATGRTLT